MSVLLWGLPADSPLSAVHHELQQLNVPVRFIDQRAALDTHVCLSVDAGVRGEVRIGDESIPLEDVQSVYWRAYDAATLPHIIEAGATGRTTRRKSTIC